MALRSPRKTILVSPRLPLLENKNEQLGVEQNLLFFQASTKSMEVEKYLSQCPIPKILVTNDSFPRLSGCIPNKAEWRVVVDEFHFLLSDSAFKSEVEYRLLQYSKQFSHVTFISATPMLDEYLERIDCFKNLPYYELKWECPRLVTVKRHQVKSPINAAVSIVRRFKNGRFPYIERDGVTYESKECVIFLNSVKNIVNIIRQTELKPDEVNIIVANQEANKTLISKLGPGFSRGRLPLKGEPHKLVTFCTSVAYAGCDFYSTSASTFVISDSNRTSTTVDIATELRQIAGRQRLASNPFRDVVSLYYRTNGYDVTQAEFDARIAEKVEETKAIIEEYRDSAPARKPKKLARIKKLQDLQKYSDDYAMCDGDDVVFNNMMMFYEMHHYQVWQ